MPTGVYRRMTFWWRFWSKVDKRGPIMPGMSTPCWIWNGSRNRRGYGTISIGGKPYLAHRAGFELEGGSYPPGKPLACHRCDNPPCVRGDHIFAGSDADNFADMERKGRAHRSDPERGEDHYNAKFTATGVMEARQLRAAGATLKELGERFGVSLHTVFNAVNRRSWRHV